MKNKVELPFSEPPLKTYHQHMTVGVCLYGNPTLWNWYLNQSTNLSCNKRFLAGFTTPNMNIENVIYHDCPYLDKWWYPMKFAKGYINQIIREFLDAGYYVYFHGVDDYYLENKSFYGERHYDHDGIIFGYDQEKKTYNIYAYDSNWVCNKLVVSQKSFSKGREAMFSEGSYGNIFGIKPMDDNIEFDVQKALDGIEEYLDSSLEKYPPAPSGMVYGIVVQEYLVMYFDKLIDGFIPHDKMDWRVMRLLWEHKKLMLARIKKIEQTLNFPNSFSTKYEAIEKEVNALRMSYATYSLRKRDKILVNICERLKVLSVEEKEILKALLNKTKGIIAV